MNYKKAFIALVILAILIISGCTTTQPPEPNGTTKPIDNQTPQTPTNPQTPPQNNSPQNPPQNQPTTPPQEPQNPQSSFLQAVEQKKCQTEPCVVLIVIDPTTAQAISTELIQFEQDLQIE